MASGLRPVCIWLAQRTGRGNLRLVAKYLAAVLDADSRGAEVVLSITVGSLCSPLEISRRSDTVDMNGKKKKINSEICSILNFSFFFPVDTANLINSLMI